MRMAGMSLTRVGAPFDGDCSLVLVTFFVLVIIILWVGLMNPRFCPVSMFVCVCVCVCVWGLCVRCHRGVLTSLSHHLPTTRQPLPGLVLFCFGFRSSPVVCIYMCKE
jgi:hypothetical protein